MIQNYKILTVSHQNVKTEEVVHFDIRSGKDDGLGSVKQWMQDAAIEEVMLLSTCNRVMYLMYTSSPTEDTLEKLNSHLSDRQWTSDDIQTYEGMDAVKHLFKVGASMDSLVIGEREIFRQLKEAYEESSKAGLTGDHLRILQKSLVKSSKRIYTESKIGEKSVSIVSLAMQLFNEKNIPSDELIMILGAGATVKLISKFIDEMGYKNVHIYNRSLDNAQKIAEQYDWQAFGLDSLGSSPHNYGAIISCTSADTPPITTAIMDDLGLTARPITIVDLAVPQDVSSEVSKRPEVSYIEISDLKDLADKNHSFRAKELKKAEAILEEELTEFEALVHRRFVEKAFASIPHEVELVKQKAINEVFASDLATMDGPSREIAMKMMDYMAKKCIALPMKTAKEQYVKIKNLEKDSVQK